MGDLVVRVVDVTGRLLDDLCDVQIIDTSTGSPRLDKRGFRAKKTLKVKGLAGVHSVRVMPTRYRAVSKFVSVPIGGLTTVTLACPVDPKRVTRPVFPEYGDLPLPLRTVLDRSRLESGPAPSAGDSGPLLYGGLDNLQKAGLLNLFTKMSNVPLDGANCWAQVEDVYRIRGDRIFANVQQTFRDAIKTATASGLLEGASGTLHTPPPGFTSAKSFKTRDSFGNLQLTFFSSVDTPLRFRIDADIDDAAGIGHAFQVIDHALTNGATHPYDVHQILTFHQSMPPPYELTV